MQKFWSEIPKTFRITICVAVALVLVATLGSFAWKNAAFAAQVAITGGFSIALLAAYVIWVRGVRVTADRKIRESGQDEDVASAAVLRIQVASFLKLVVLAAFLIVLVAVFHFDVISSFIGVTVIYLPMIFVPLFVKSDSDAVLGEAEAPSKADKSEVHS